MLKAERVKMCMAHKDDIIFGVIARAEHEIMSGAYRGESGILFEYSKEYDGFAEINVFYDLLMDKGYTVTIEAADDLETTRIGIYWAV